MYTNSEIQAAFDIYCKRTDAVRDILKLAPLNANDINKIVHSGERFMVIEHICQMGMVGIYEDEIRICTELLLQQNPEKPINSDFTEEFASMPLEVERKPFFMVAYSERIFDYVIGHTKLERQLPKARMLSTDKGTLFYLAREEDINRAFHSIDIF